MHALVKSVGAIVAAVLVAPEREELRAVYSEDVALVVRSESTTRMELGDLSGTVNGQELPPEALEEIGGSMTSEDKLERVELTVTIDEVEDGRPIAATHEYAEVWRRKTDGDEETEEEGPLDGRTVKLRLGDDDEVEAEIADDGEDVDELYLKDHLLSYVCEHYLPDDEAEEGDSWDLDEDAVFELLRRSGGPELFIEENAEQEAAFEEAFEDSERGEGTVTWETTEERGGLRCALLVVELTVEFSADDVGDMIFGDDAPGESASVSMDGDAEGTTRVWFALEEGRPVAEEYDFDGEMEITMLIEEDGFEIEMEMVMELSGEGEKTWSEE